MEEDRDEEGEERRGEEEESASGFGLEAFGLVD